MPENLDKHPLIAAIFRIALFAAAASLAAYIPYKYATQLHAISGSYALLFPLSSVLALAGMALAIRPRAACQCGGLVRGGIGALAVLWMATGLLCVGMLTASVLSNPLQGLIAAVHMVAQHVFLSLSLLAFVLMPERVVRALGQDPLDTTAHPAAETAEDF
ncbi:MAG: hypothetical protein H0W33_00870 [Gammaproteobacteria bacterium]|nr:hypothetical protein [Gammaproteobacteria bacterium]